MSYNVIFLSDQNYPSNHSEFEKIILKGFKSELKL